MESKEKKVEYVKSQGQTRNHHCHWIGCDKQVPPAMWGCYKHWRMLPAILRNKIWAAYQPGQEVNGTPSKEYVRVAREVQNWIRNYLAAKEEEKARKAKEQPKGRKVGDLPPTLRKIARRRRKKE